MAIYKLKPGKLDLEVVWGEPWSLSFVVSINLTGYTCVAAFRQPNGVETPMDVDVTNGATSTVGLSVSDAEMTALPLGTMRWYFKWTPPSGLERTALAGDVSVERP